MSHYSEFDSALYGVPNRIRRFLEYLPDELKAKTEEIRLRVGLPVTLTVGGAPVFIDKRGNPCNFVSRELLTADKSEIDEAFLLLCHNSVYAHTQEIKNGYVVMNSGHRAGVCGTVLSDGMRDISSVNIRIAREILGSADSLIQRFDGGGVLIAGPPGSGKTTMLRDAIRQLSDGKYRRYLRVAVIDSRGELSGSNKGKSANYLGSNTDILLTEDKASGALMALRTMFPDIIAFDEIGTAAELKSVSDCFNAGVSVITTAHIGTKEDLFRRSVTSQLLKSNAVSTVVVLTPNIYGQAEIYDVGELIDESDF